MGESTKAASALVLIVSSILAVFAWMADRPDAATWAFRIGVTLLAVLALGLILALQLRADVEHDYLRSITGTYFNRDGFCFTFVMVAVDGIAYMDAYFQTQYDRSSVGQIALRPARGFFMTRAKIDGISFKIECPPAGFGFARIAIPLPEAMQGKRHSFEVGAAVTYPEGKGRRIRYHDGVFLRSNTKFASSVDTALIIAGAATGSIVLTKPATVQIDLPAGVTEDLPENIAPETITLWQLGQPALGNDA